MPWLTTWLHTFFFFAASARREFPGESRHQVRERHADRCPPAGGERRRVVRLERVGAAEESHQTGEPSRFLGDGNHVKRGLQGSYVLGKPGKVM